MLCKKMQDYIPMRKLASHQGQPLVMCLMKTDDKWRVCKLTYKHQKEAFHIYSSLSHTL